jgi:dTDP-4-dehydro-6-deoxy-alpha-D-glucopyranose 2,3-dehydratase
VPLDFLKSALCDTGVSLKTGEVVDWLQGRRDLIEVQVQKIDFAELDNWSYDRNRGTLSHESGRFFSIDGINVNTNSGSVKNWDQPIINQHEIGYLGFITKKFDGVLHFLLQAKIEPGNLNYVQLSPTLQATKSNYDQVHQGTQPLYLEYFRQANHKQILLDQLQSEQGARFLRKRNRNIIIEVDEDIPDHPDFIWLTLGQLKQLTKVDNLVNMDSRTVISGIPYGELAVEVVDLTSFYFGYKDADQAEPKILKSALSQEGAVNSIEQVITFITQQKSVKELEIVKKPLHDLATWTMTESAIHHANHDYFRVIAVNVVISNREVTSWSQPMIEPAQEGLCAFVCKEINGVLHFAMQAKLECGNLDIIELAPTVQCLTGNYRSTGDGNLPFLEYVLTSPSSRIYLDTMQSEEGGRFYREQNRNMIVFGGDEVPTLLPPNYIWMTLSQLHVFLKFNNFLNIQSRSLIAALSFI